ncbi:hypothetical protein [Helicobacter sp.]|uniref:hypothetical protein n=1 Tax=Helicobacter sp. TaxID=218 RepID=UPI0019AA4EF9|nr:hypothetical protein [Helicobacter sp.]MBD5164607.1 hypothetical protein [Helicobacter sp.]
MRHYNYRDSTCRIVLLSSLQENLKNFVAIYDLAQMKYAICVIVSRFIGVATHKIALAH